MNRRHLLRLLGGSALAGVTGCSGPGPETGLAASSRSDPGGLDIEPDVELELTAAPDEVSIVSGAPTHVWRFSGRVLRGPDGTLEDLPGSYLGPVMRLRRGQRVRVRLANRIGEESIVHWHGLDVPADADGHPRLAIGHGESYVYDFEVANRAGTYWYHPHPHRRTGPQVYAGLAGLLLVSDDDEAALGLPSGESEILCVLQDRQFDADNQLIYAADMGTQVNGFLGDRLLVNGRFGATRDVDRGWYRVRLLNGSNARLYRLAWSDGRPMTIIGGDGGLLERPIERRELTLAPGQRADTLIDLTATAGGAEVHLDSLAFPEADAGGGMMGMNPSLPNGAPLRALTLRVGDRPGMAFAVPARLPSFDPSWSASAGSRIRTVPLAFQRMQWTLDGRTFSMTDAAAEERVTAGSTHAWEFANQVGSMGMGMGGDAAHPIHIHGRQFRILGRTGGRGNQLRAGIVDDGWQDTTLVLPGETVRVQVTFSSHPGDFLYHCHILEHEDMGMMRNFRIIPS